jgi:hypothetical protein
MIAAIVTLVGVLASLAGIYALSEPKLVAIPQHNHWSGQLSAEHSNGFAIWLDGDTIFRNESIRRGAFVSAIVIVPQNRPTDDWLPPRLATVSNDEFGAYEQKLIAFRAQTRMAELPSGKAYPPFSVKLYFLDQRGSYIKERGKDTAYSLALSLPPEWFSSLKRIDDLRAAGYSASTSK